MSHDTERPPHVPADVEPLVIELTHNWPKVERLVLWPTVQKKENDDMENISPYELQKQQVEALRDIASTLRRINFHLLELAPTKEKTNGEGTDGRDL